MLIFDTRFTGDGFDYVSETFPQGNVVDAVSWAHRVGVADLVRSVCYGNGEAVLQSRRRWTSREDAERALARFLARVRGS